MSLEDRFFDFMDRYPSAKNIDREFKFEGEKADYIVDDGRFIFEVKNIENDPSYKAHEFANKLEERPEYPLFYGDRELSDVLKHFPDAENLNRDLFGKVTRQIERSLKKANSQIAATRRALGFEDACGLVVLLNDQIPSLDPDHLVSTVSTFLCKKRDGITRYQEIAFTWIIAETHRLHIPVFEESIPAILIEGPMAERYESQGRDIDRILEAWSRYNGYHYAYFEGVKNTRDVKFFTKEQLETPPPTSISRQVLWEREYRASRYLADRSDLDFFEHACRVLDAMTPHFMKGGEKLSESAIREMMAAWTHCLEEFKLRNTDMRKFNEYRNSRRNVSDQWADQEMD